MSNIELPKGWQYVQLGDKNFFLDIIGGGTPIRNNSKFFGGGIPWVRLKDMKSKYIIKTGETLTKLGLQKSAAKLLPKNAVILSTRATIGEVAISKTQLCTNQGFKSIICNEDKILPEYTYYFLKSIKKTLQSKSKSSTFAEINKTNLEMIQVIVPPIEVQKKIVKKLDYILGQVEQKKDDIRDNIESNNELITTLSDKIIGSIIHKKMSIGSVPDEWKNMKLTDACIDIQPGFAQGNKNVEGGIIHLRMNNIGTNFKINYDLTRTVNATENQIKKYSLHPGDIIFNNTNSKELVGKSAIFEDGQLCLYSNHLTRLRPNTKIITSGWLLFYLRARWMNGDFTKMCMKWINQAAVNNTKIRELIIPIPSIPIQNSIVEELKLIDTHFQKTSKLFSEIKNNHKSIKESLNKIETQILSTAFSGKLAN